MPIPSRRSLVGFSLFALPVFVPTPAAAQTVTTALVRGIPLNPASAPVRDAVVVVRGQRIVCAGARGARAVPPGARSVDARGAFIIPGLIDAHVHYSQTGWVDGRPDAFDVRAELPYDSTVVALQREPDRFHRAWLCSGVHAERRAMVAWRPAARRSGR